INNNLEMKVKSKKDTVAKKVSILNTLSISSGYNLLADSFKLANFSLAANTNVLNDKLNINITANLDPYKYVTIVGNEDPEAKEREIRTRLYSWNNYVAPAGYTVVKVGGVPGRITNANLALSTNLNPKGQGKDNVTRDKISKANISDTDKQFLLNNPDTYVDFNIPWNLRLSYNVDYSRPPGSTKANITQAMRFNGDISLTEKWKIQFNSGYDFQQKEITQTLLTLARDLHCWQLNLSWTPFGKFQSYNFFIGIKSSMLKDLKLNRTRSFFDN
ncbi:MAG: LPS-assembly protein LptD, partial [Cyclobacteriaceae bacterium]|nr:LPS-assembly protein LptD [Cyclobacteriaceae bacterium]